MNTSDSGSTFSDDTYLKGGEAKAISLSLLPGGNEMELCYPASNAVRIMLVAGADGLVTGMQMLDAGSIGTTIQTGHLPTGLYSVVIHSSEERRIIGFVR
jgi:hypothetical protein